MTLARSLRFQASRTTRRLRREIYRHLYVDRDRDPSASIVVAGSARSGTTWLGDLLASAARARVVFEPLNRDRVPEMRGISPFPYRRPGYDDPQLVQFCTRMLSGSLSGPWVDREVERIVSHRRVVKLVRGNLLLGWLSGRFPDVPMFLLVRHPCAVVASRMLLGWDPAQDLEALLVQDRLLDDHLASHRDLIAGAASLAERNAVLWCIHHLIPWRQRETATFRVTFYEHLCAQPELELKRLLESVGGELRPLQGSVLRRPSHTSRASSATVTGGDAISSWQNSLSSDQIDRVLGIVRAFGLDDLYGEDPMPRQSALWSADGG